MTTPYVVEKIWLGRTVLVIGGGPSAPHALCDETLRDCPRIVVNHACQLAPDADMLVALDGNWPEAFRSFAGLRVTGVSDVDLDALYIGPSYERIAIDTGHVIEVRNSGLTAIRLAAAAGAARIVIAGFDPETPGHFDGYPSEETIFDGVPYPGATQGLAALIAELTAQGVVVEHADVVSNNDRRDAPLTKAESVCAEEVGAPPVGKKKTRK